MTRHGRLENWWHQDDLLVRGHGYGEAPSGTVLAFRHPVDGHPRWGAWAQGGMEFKAHLDTEGCPYLDGAEDRKCCPRQAGAR